MTLIFIYQPMETLFPLLVAALEVFNRYGLQHGLQHVRYTLSDFFYKDILEMFKKRVISIRPDIADKWILHHDNALYYTALSVTEFSTSKGIPLVPHPSSPDLMSCDFFLFPKLKNVLKRRNFGTFSRNFSLGIESLEEGTNFLHKK